MAEYLDEFVTTLTLLVHIGYPQHDPPPPPPPGHTWNMISTMWLPEVNPTAGVNFEMIEWPGTGTLVLEATFTGVGSWAFTGVNVQAWQLEPDDIPPYGPSWWDVKRATIDTTINSPDSGKPPWECKGAGWCCCSHTDEVS